MSFKYDDVELGEKRYGRFCPWCLWAYLAGLASGLLIAASLH